MGPVEAPGGGEVVGVEPVGAVVHQWRRDDGDHCPARPFGNADAEELHHRVVRPVCADAARLH